MVFTMNNGGDSHLFYIQTVPRLIMFLKIHITSMLYGKLFLDENHPQGVLEIFHSLLAKYKYYKCEYIL